MSVKIPVSVQEFICPDNFYAMRSQIAMERGVIQHVRISACYSS